MKENMKRYPFDQYTRCLYIRNFIKKISDDMHIERPKVLDLGGYKGGMEEFLGDFCDLWVMDIYDSNDPKYIKGDARDTKAKTGEYDFVFMSDVMEHLQHDDRPLAVKEAIRISKYGTLFCFPHYQEKTEIYEKSLDRFYRFLTGNSHQWFEEHVANVLPKKEEISKAIKAIPNIRHLEFTSNDVDLWFNAVVLNFIAFEEGISSGFIFDVYEYYNNNIEKIDIVEDGYRDFHCVWKNDIIKKNYQISDFTGYPIQKFDAEQKQQFKKELVEKIKEYFQTLSDPIRSDPKIYELINKVQDVQKNIFFQKPQNIDNVEMNLYKQVYNENRDINYTNKNLGENILHLQNKLNEIRRNNEDYKEIYLHTVNSRSWKIALFIKRVRKVFSKRGLKAIIKLILKSIKVLLTQGPINLLKRIRGYRGRRFSLKDSGDAKAQSLGIHQPQSKTVDEIISQRFGLCQKLDTIFSLDDALRVNLLMPTLRDNSMFGAVATAIIFSTLLAEKMNAKLRIICTDETGSLSPYYKLAEIFKLPIPVDVELYDASQRRSGASSHRMEVTEHDIFISTIWWTSYIARSCNMRKKFIYMVQEFEPVFYPNGDDRILVQESYTYSDTVPLVNSKILYDYVSALNFSSIKESGIYFEPAMPSYLYHPDENTFLEKKKYRLFFFSRPNMLRNLFYRGIKIIDKAIEEGILDTNEFEICFAGEMIENIKFADGSSPRLLGKLSFPDYAKFLATVDLGLSLMEAPHPSYPPLDLASAGAVVLTNNYETKTNLYYSKNILFSDSNMVSMMQGMKDAIALAKDLKQRESNYKENQILIDWHQSFDHVIEKLVKDITEGKI